MFYLGSSKKADKPSKLHVKHSLDIGVKSKKKESAIIYSDESKTTESNDGDY